jgi:hypothetical protein
VNEEIKTELLRLSRLLDQGLSALRDQAREFAEAEAEYRRLKATSWIEVLRALPEATVAQREAWVNGATADARLRRDLADGLRQAALEAVRSRRGQLSALQSLLAAERAEADFARTGPEWAT